MTAEPRWSRRGFLTTGAALAVGTLSVGTARAAEGRRPEPASFSASQLEAVVEATANCQKVGEACLALAAKQLGQGETRMSRCQETCINMLALTGAMLTVATHATADANTISELAAVTAKTCRECEAACEEFEAPAYKRCAESCRRTATACEALSSS